MAAGGFQSANKIKSMFTDSSWWDQANTDGALRAIKAPFHRTEWGGGRETFSSGIWYDLPLVGKHMSLVFLGEPHLVKAPVYYLYGKGEYLSF